MSVAWQPIAAALGSSVQTALDGVELGTKVYTTLRWTNEPEQFEDLFRNTVTSTLSAWFITRDGGQDFRGGEGGAGRALNLPIGHRARNHLVRIEGYLAFRFDGSSEELFQELIDAVMDKLTNGITLDGAACHVYPPSFSLPEGGLTEFGPIICHMVAIKVEVSVRTSGAYS